MKSESFESEIIKNCDENIINKTIIINDTKNDIKLDIMVSKANYGLYLYYRIKCDTPMKNSYLHPFAKISIDYITQLESGEIEIAEVVADNEMIRKMFEYLSMDDIELKKHTGNSHHTQYRSAIINCITQLWD